MQVITYKYQKKKYPEFYLQFDKNLFIIADTRKWIKDLISTFSLKVNNGKISF